MVNQKSAFWKALVLTVIVFLLGIGLGILIEEYRFNDVRDVFEEFFLDWNDIRLQRIYYEEISGEACDISLEKNLEFGDRIYEQGLLIDKYEKANRLTEKLEIEKRRYNLLKTEFLLNNRLLKERCGFDYDILIYFYQDKPESLEIKQEQNVLSRVLFDLKMEKGRDLILIPLATDLNVSVVDTMEAIYGIDTYPSLLINDYYVLKGVHEVGDIKALL